MGGCRNGCIDECNNLAPSQLNSFNETEHIDHSRPIIETSIISFKETGSSKTNTINTTSTVAAPLTPPASLFNINFEQTPHESQFIQEGWMFKQSRHFKTWNRRWFVLYNDKLYYFKNSKVTACKMFEIYTLLV